jgi:erythrin-vacuolar iron transport family protein
MKSFEDLTQQEVLALAISSEEEDGRIYSDFAEGLREEHPDTAKVFSDMAEEENDHRRMLIDLYVFKFGSHIPLVRRQDVRGFVHRKRLWQVRLQGIEAVRQQAKQMEQDAGRFYLHAASRATDAGVRKLLGDLASAESQHERTAGDIEEKRLPNDARAGRMPTLSEASFSKLSSPVSLA